MMAAVQAGARYLATFPLHHETPRIESLHKKRAKWYSAQGALTCSKSGATAPKIPKNR
jgi:hypothetical protein